MVHKFVRSMSSHESLDSRLTELNRQLKQKDMELDQEVDDIMAADFDALDAEKRIRKTYATD